MKKIFVVVLLVILTIFAITLINNKRLNREYNQYEDFKMMNYKLQTTSYKLLVADTPAKWERGLMFFRKLDGVDGMIFIFPKKDYRTFWNKNTLMDLKLLWLDDDDFVGESFLPSIEKSKQIVIVNSPQPANKVIELPSY